MNKETIAAIATANGSGGIGIVRLSGACALSIGQQITERALKPRISSYSAFKDNKGETIDHGIAIFFEGPASYTGEDVVELQAHGGSVVLDLLLKEALSQGARMARPGEFSERAFLNDKIDLLQAESVADIIESHSEAALRSSIRTYSGEFSKKINALVKEITELRMYVEAAIDFPEEEVDFVSDGYIKNSLLTLLQSVESILKQSNAGAILSHGIDVAIIGKPNAGKSSLLNALAAEEVAIVTEQAGTTRDLVKQHLVLEDIPLNVIDTAGLRHSDDLIEQEGIKRVRSVTEGADAIFYIRDVSIEGEGFNEETMRSLIKTHELSFNPKTQFFIINNKVDLIGKQPSFSKQDRFFVISLSAKEKDGVALIAKAIKQHFHLENTTENAFSARRRHITQIEATMDSLEKGLAQLEGPQAGELVAEDLRQAQNALGQITGKVSSDDLLGEIFSSFCIGK